MNRERLSVQVIFRMAQSAILELDQRAKDAGLTRSEYIRKVITEHLTRGD